MCNAAASSMAALKQPTIRVVAIDRMCTGKQQGCTIDAKLSLAQLLLEIGDTAGTIDNIIHCKLYRTGSVGFVSKSVVPHIIDVIKTWVGFVSVISVDGKEGPANNGQPPVVYKLLNHQKR
ncbi:hypothetical protein EV2_036969 [Malus domestica]|uniref:Uncharacterized protein n=1 Tax=Malus domestica TaxID=3750 RepID=A0A498JRV8_MALDO|nr:hypothetical protein DVH24_010833 [Malus domestica]